MNLLLVGALPPPIGGTTVLFKQLVDDLRNSEEVRLRVIDISRSKVGGIHDIVHALRCLALLLWNLPWASVLSFQTSKNGAITFGPVVHVLSRLFRRKWIFRGFGGDLATWHENTQALHRRLFDRTVLKADVLLFERKTSVQYFQARSVSPVQWYPNSRRRNNVQPALSKKMTRERRFVFVGHVKPAKGIGEILQAAKVLQSRNFIVDVFGPLQDGVTTGWFDDSSVTYRGPLASDAVIRTLSEYDVLLLPTYAEIEGYPGVILEAYCAGIPVITTRWGGIPEIVTQETGILVEPRDVEGLAKAMQAVMDSDELLQALREGARTKAGEFDANRWTRCFIDLCHHTESR
ncbi:MAG: glycosyltransferase family 4 protein [Nitrospira sp.]